MTSLVENLSNSSGLRYRNPDLTSAFRFPSELQIGSKIYIAGYATKEVTRFSFNLQNGSTDESDVYFHLNVRFDDNSASSGKAVVRNACFDNVWGDEERDTTSDSLFSQNPFLIVITILDDEFIVEVDGSELITFAHRNQSISNITYIRIEGSVIITDLHLPFQDDRKGSDKWISIPGTQKVGDLLCLNASFAGGDRFAVNLLTGQSNSDDIAYHFNPRFTSDSAVIILNHRSQDNWGEEIEIANSDTFDIKDSLNNFNLVIVLTESVIKAFINGHAIEEFQHRLALDSIKYCVIEGDLSVQSVTFNSLPYNKEKYKNVILRDSAITTLPYTDDISSSKLVIVTAFVVSDPIRFYINLQLNSSNIALHFNPRWNDQKTGGEILLFNTKTNDEWGSEIREPLLIKANAFYDFIFKFDGENKIEVIINGQGFKRSKAAKISHPFNNSDVNQIEINGSIDVKQIAFIS